MSMYLDFNEARLQALRAEDSLKASFHRVEVDSIRKDHRIRDLEEENSTLIQRIQDLESERRALERHRAIKEWEMKQLGEARDELHDALGRQERLTRDARDALVQAETRIRDVVRYFEEDRVATTFNFSTHTDPNSDVDRFSRIDEVRAEDQCRFCNFTMTDMTFRGHMICSLCIDSGEPSVAGWRFCGLCQNLEREYAEESDGPRETGNTNNDEPRDFRLD